jgi:hypothetical protein
MIQIAMTPEQYAKARAALCTGSQVRSHIEHGDDAGSFDTPQVSMDYNYAAGTLTLDVTAKRGMAHFASDEQIKEHLLDLLAKA